MNDFKPTAELRYERRIHPFDMYSYKVLQQKWVADDSEEWRDVPSVDGPDLRDSK